MKPPVRKDSAMKRRHFRYFSLIELLVVIAVIMILAGLLFPALRSTRESARKAQCLANQNNISVYIQQYAINNNRSMKVISNWSTWYRDLIAANGGFKTDSVPNNGYMDPKTCGNYLNNTGLGMLKVFKCPSDQSPGATASYGRNNPSRGGTMKYRDGSNGSEGDALVDPRLVNSKVSDPKRPSDLILITDHWGKNHQPGESCNTEEYDTVNVYHLRIREGDTSIGDLGTVRDDTSRHKGSPPILYVDGHITATNWKSTIPPRFYDLTTAYNKGLGWQGRAVGSWSDDNCVKK